MIEKFPYIHAAITEIPKVEWQRFFFSFRSQELQKVENCDEKDLTKIQIRVKLLREIENYFLKVYETKSTN